MHEGWVTRGPNLFMPLQSRPLLKRTCDLVYVSGLCYIKLDMFSDPKKKKKGGQKATTIEELPDEDDELGDLDLDDDIPPKVSQCKFANMVVSICHYLLSKLKQFLSLFSTGKILSFCTSNLNQLL